MAGMPLTNCNTCGYMEFLTHMYIGTSGALLGGGNIESPCSRCGGTSNILKGNWRGTEKGILFEAFGLTQDEIIVAFEIIGADDPSRKYSRKEITRLDHEFQKRTNSDEQPFTKLSAWQKTKRVGYVLTLVCVISTAISGVQLAYDSHTKEKLKQLPMNEKYEIEKKVNELEKQLEQIEPDKTEKNKNLGPVNNLPFKV